MVFLDIWLADRDGLETLQALREADPTAAVVMMSGHGTTSTAVKAIKMGAYDYLEKPLSYKRAVDAAAGALEYKRTLQEGGEPRRVPERTPRDRGEAERRFTAAPDLPLLAETRRGGSGRSATRPWSTASASTRASAPAWSSSRCPRTAASTSSPCPPASRSRPTCSAVAETDYATTLSGDGESIKTVEHLLSALHAYGVGNLLIKVHGEIPVLDGSALEFCKVLEEVGVAEQDGAAARGGDRPPLRGGGRGRRCWRSSRRTASRSPTCCAIRRRSASSPTSSRSRRAEAYKREIAPARTFGFMKDLKMLNELGPRLRRPARQLHPGRRGRGPQHRAPLPRRVRPPQDPRHHRRPLPAGLPIRGKVTARLTGHRDNIALLRRILAG